MIWRARHLESFNTPLGIIAREWAYADHRPTTGSGYMIPGVLSSGVKSAKSWALSTYNYHICFYETVFVQGGIWYPTTFDSGQCRMGKCGSPTIQEAGHGNEAS